MISLSRLLVALWIPAVVGYSQSIRLQPSAPDGKSSALFSVVLDSPAARAPVALQWEFAIPPAILVSKEDILIGKAAELAKKSLICAPKTNKSAGLGGVRYSCILAGGQDPIGAGTIATVRYCAQTDVHGAPIRVAIEKILGVSADLKRIEIPNADAILTLR